MEKVDSLLIRYPVLESCKAEIEKTITRIIECYEYGGKVLVCGNGGSYADAEHIVGELMKGFCRKRPLDSERKKALEDTGVNAGDKLIGKKLGDMLQSPLRALTLGGMPALSSAFANDVDSVLVYAQQALGLTEAGDVFIGISTSGNAQNVLAAAVTAKACGATTIGMSGKDGGSMNGMLDILIKVPETDTYRIQELHLPVYHAICLEVESRFFSS